MLETIDSKHIRIEYPRNSGTVYHNYKGFFSLVLLAVCDDGYCFSMFDVGEYGRHKDSGVLAYSSVGKRFERRTFNLLGAKPLQGCKFSPLSYYLLGEKIFPLKL